MTHYGITGFGTVAAFAKALKLDEDASKLEAAVKDMHSGDELMSRLPSPPSTSRRLRADVMRPGDMWRPALGRQRAIFEWQN